MDDIHIVNALIVNEGSQMQGHLAIKAGRIRSISSDLPNAESKQIIDARGAWVIPGLIDDQVHFREPGFPKKGTIYQESRAAVAGGITSYMEMPNTKPPTLDAEQLEYKHQIAARDSAANYSFYLGASNDNIEHIKRVDGKRVPGVKVFMGSSTGNMRVSEPEVLEQIFKHSPLLVATHCEDDDMIHQNLQLHLAEYGEDIPPAYHPVIRSREACLKSSSLAVELAKRHDADLHILHITTADELELFQPGDIDGKKITSEACVHHLFFDESSYGQLGHQIKCNPAIKADLDRKAIVEAVNEDRIDIIATDHAPHEFLSKQLPYTQAPAGLPLAQHSLPILLELVHRGEMALETVVEKTSHAVARRFDVIDRGYLREDYWADIVICKIDDETSEESANLLYSRCGWSPFEEIAFSGKIEDTLISGSHAYHNGKVIDGVRGRALDFNR